MARLNSPARSAAYALLTAVLFLPAAECALRLGGLLYRKGLEIRTPRSGASDGGIVVLTYGGSHFLRGYPRELESLLRAARPGTAPRVINMAAFGIASSEQMLKHLPSHLSTFRPRAVVLNINFRESALGRRRELSPWARANSFLLARSRLAQAAAFLLEEVRERPATAGRVLIRPQATAKGYLEIADLLALVNELGGEREALSRAFALEQSEETALRIAKLHMKSGRPDLGRRWLLKHLDRWDSTRVRISLADFNLQSGRRAEAEAHLAAARERAGTNPDNVADLARWHMNNGREDEAESLLRAGLATSNHPRLRMILHHLYTIDKRDAEAEHELEMLRAIPGSEPFLAMAHIHQNRPDLARPIVERWISNGREERESALSTYLLKELRIAPTLEELRAAADRRGAPSDHFFLAARFMNQDRPEEAAPLVAKILAQVDAPEIRRILNDSRPEAGAGPADASESGRTHGPFCPRLESNLREAGALCRAAGAAFYADNTGLENRARQSGPWTCAVAAAREEGFGTIDVMGALDRLTSTAERHRITGTGTHFPLEGYRWAARIAFDALSGKLLDPPEKTASSNGTERIW